MVPHSFVCTSTPEVLVLSNALAPEVGLVLPGDYTSLKKQFNKQNPDEMFLILKM